MILSINASSYLPTYEKFYTPMNDYVYEKLQPSIDDILFMGKNYDRAFDKFEVFFSLVFLDIQQTQGKRDWFPPGRFCWKARNTVDNDPLSKLMFEANTLGEN